MFWMAAISMAGSFASGALGGWATYEQGKQQDENAQYNARILEAAADEEMSQRSTESGIEREEASHRLASMEARYAKSGLAITGTPLYQMEDQAETDEFNILARDRASQIWVDDQRTQAENLRIEGRNAKKAGKIGAFTQLLGGAAQAAGTGASYGLNVGSKATPAPSKPASFLPETSTYGPFNPQMNTIRSFGKQKQFSLGN